MIVSVHQPAYLPWLGYLHKILISDVFVVLDTVQIEKNGFTNRNRVRTSGGVKWLTVPLKMKGHTGSSIGEMEINNADKWKAKHIRTLEQSYGKRPYFAEAAGGLFPLIEGAGDSLTDFLSGMLEFFLAAIGAGDVRVLRAFELSPEGQRSDLLLDICRRLGADTYLSGPGAKEYLETQLFDEAGIEVRFQEFRHPEYDQGHPFEPRLSIVDALFNCGGGAIVPMLEAA